MKRLHIACGQFEAVLGDKSANIGKIENLIGEAADRGCELVVFPEMAVTGYLPPEDMPKLAEPADGPSGIRIRAAAKRFGIAVAYGFSEVVEGAEKKRNTFSLIDSGGSEIGRYRKIHLWDTEAAWCDPGEEVPIFDLYGTNISGWICYDTRFPELSRLEYLAGAEVCLVPTAWLGPIDEWIVSVRARALDNMFFVAGADLINPMPGLECRGASVIAGPHGNILARAELDTECVIDAILDPAELSEQRERVPLMRDRKPELYHDIAKSSDE